MSARLSISASLPAEDEENDEEIPQRPPLSPSLANSGTPLDRTIDKIGMGGYQYILLSLCGLGWAADNMWLQAIAIALPRVQVHYDVISTSIGYLSAAIFAGMMIGALMWGTLSDLLGRATVFNLTLFFTAIFGFFTYLVETFPLLCLASFFLGTAVGGSMPTDGTFALETLPRRKRHLLTSLSVFFSLGSVMAAIVALFVIPNHSCPPVRHEMSASDEHGDCDVQQKNNGWKYLFLILSGITFAMFVARILFFRLHESPRFLVHAGRQEEAVEALAEIAKFNGTKLTIIVTDVNDEGEAEDPVARPTSYHATESSYMGAIDVETEGDHLLNGTSRPTHHRRRMSTASMLSTASRRKVNSIIPKWIRHPIREWFRRIQSLLTGEWKQKTILIWSIWGNMAFAYTMFNVFLPTLLEYRTNDGNQESNTPPTLDGPLWEVLLFTLAGTPGAPLGAYLVAAAPRRGLSKSFLLALFTLITGIFCLGFILVTGYYTIMITSMAMSLTSTAMWSILYGMTPELFATEVRGTASGTASALSRIGGVLAPLVGGILVSINPILVSVASVVIFLLTAFLLVLLDRNLKRAGHSVHQMSTPPRYEAIDRPSEQ